MTKFDPSHIRFSRSRASALIAILWIISILSLAVFSATQFLFVELESEANSSSLFRAEMMAERGLAIAANPDIKKGDILLSQSFRNGEAFSVRISSEGDRLNLNAILANPENDRRVLENLFSEWGLRRDEAEDVVDCLIDWVDADDEPTMVGAERTYYYGKKLYNQPFNRPFESLNEVLLVKNFDLVVAANPHWKEAFTLLSEGPLDLNEAPAELIAAACEVSVEMAAKFISVRNGLDGSPGTRDDIVFDSVESALSILGVSPDATEGIDDRISIEDSSRRILTVGRSGGISVERSVTVQYTDRRATIQSWATRRVE